MAGGVGSSANAADRTMVEQLWRRFRPAVLRYFQRRGIPSGDAEDMVQELFMRLSRREGLATLEHIEGYLFEATASIAVDYFRRDQIRRAVPEDVYRQSCIRPEEFTPERLAQSREQFDRLLKAIDDMPERRRTVFVLAHFENQKHPEIARRLGITVSAVEKHLVKAVAQLSRSLDFQP